MALRREVGTRTRVSCRGCGMSDLMAVMQNLWMFVAIVIGVLLQQVSGDLCNDYTVIVDDWRAVSSTAQTNQCDKDAIHAGIWYAFQVKGRQANIPTECIKNNKCGAEIPMRLDLNASLPAEGKVIEASLCGSYNILGKYDCCVLRTPVRISVCSGVTVYQFPTKPIDRCSVAICAQDPEEPPPSRSVIARTGDVHDETMTTEITATIDVHSSPAEGDTVSLSTTISTDSTIEPRSSDTSPVEGDTVSLSATISTDSTSEPRSSDTSDATDLFTSSSEAHQGTTPLLSDEPTTDIYASPASPEPTDTTDVLEDAPISDAPPGGGSTSDPTDQTLIVETQSTVPTDTTPDSSFMTSETDINNAPPMDLQQTTTDQLPDLTMEFLNKTTDKLQDPVQTSDSNVTTISPPPDATDETSVPPKEVSSEVVTSFEDQSTSRDGDGSGELHENTTTADDTVVVPTSVTSITNTSGENATESGIPASVASQASESTDETPSTSAPPSDDSETSPTDGETTEPPHDDSIRGSPLTSDNSTSSTTSTETSTPAEEVAIPATTASPIPSPTPTTSQFLTTTVRPLSSGVNDLILIEIIRFVFKGNHSSIYFSSNVYNYLESFLSRAVNEYKPDSGSHWNYTLTNVYAPVQSGNVSTFVDVRIQHTAREGIITVFDKLNLESYLFKHGNLSLIAKCRASASCEIDQPTQASTQSVFEKNSPIFLTLIIICSVCLVVLLCIAVYIKCFRRGVYVAQEVEATNLADRRPYFNINPSPFTDEQIMKDEVAMEKGEKPDKVDNSSSCNGSDLIGGDSNTWVIPLDDAPVTSPVISNEDTKL